MLKFLNKKKEPDPNLEFIFKSYSQDGEDMIIRSFFEEMSALNGFYIDVGAFHPYRYSNTCYFYNRGWRGINIEPTPSAIHLFNQHRPEDINLNIAIGGHKEELTFYCFNEPALNSFSKSLSEERDGEKQYFITDRIPVMVYPLHEILTKYVPSEQTIHFMSIDVEGLDLVVLQSNNWKKFRPTYLLVEDIFEYLDQTNQSEVYHYLISLNYKAVAKTSRTLIFKDMKDVI